MNNSTNVIKRLEKAESELISKDLLIELSDSGAVSCKDMKTSKPVGISEAQSIVSNNNTFILFLDYTGAPDGNLLDIGEWHKKGAPNYELWLEIVRELREKGTED